MSRSLVTGKHPKPGPDADPGGAPSLLTQESLDALLNAIRLCGHLTVALDFVGFDRSLVRTWVKKGRQDPESLYGALARGIPKALAEGQLRNVTVIDRAAQGVAAEYERYPVGHKHAGELVFDGEGKPILKRPAMRPDWKASAFLLERAHANLWGSREHLTLDVLADGPDDIKNERDVGGDDHNKRMEHIRKLMARAEARKKESNGSGS